MTFLENMAKLWPNKGNKRKGLAFSLIYRRYEISFGDRNKLELKATTNAVNQ